MVVVSLENMTIVPLMVTVTVDTAVSDYIVRTTGTRQSNDVFASNIFEVSLNRKFLAFIKIRKIFCT